MRAKPATFETAVLRVAGWLVGWLVSFSFVLK